MFEVLCVTSIYNECVNTIINNNNKENPQAPKDYQISTQSLGVQRHSHQELYFSVDVCTHMCCQPSRLLISSPAEKATEKKSYSRMGNHLHSENRL